MKSTRLSSRMLGVCLATLAVGFASLPVRAVPPQHAAATPAASVTVRHKEASRFRLSVDSYPIEEVRRALQHALVPSTSPFLDSSIVRATLRRLYGSRLQESTTPMGYTRVWDPILEQWVIVCSSVTTYAVSFAARGTVEVEVRESERVP